MLQTKKLISKTSNTDVALILHYLSLFVAMPSNKIELYIILDAVLFFFFNWNIVALRVSFCYTTK